MSTDLTKLYETQISLTEWFENIKHQDSSAFRIEDNEKRERLKVLNEIIGLPFDKPYQFSAQEVASRTPRFKSFLQEHGDELCALRLIPLDLILPKLRTRGASINDSLVWFANQQVDSTKYRADFVPHPADHIWSTAFIVNSHGIYGEIIKGSHNQLTQGFHDEGEPIVFAYDNFAELKLSHGNIEATMYLKGVLSMLHVPSVDIQTKLKQELEASFPHDYLCGYFETVASSQFGTWFIDYNRILGKMYKDFVSSVAGSSIDDSGIVGKVGSVGKATGKVKIINSENLHSINEENFILVCEMTTAAHLPLMQKSLAIITDGGGILSHAAIISRELKKPCVVGTKNATKILKDGDMVEVDANSGIIKIIKE